MTVKELEERVLALEQQVKKISSELAETKNRPNRNWLQTVEKFAGDKDLLGIFADAQQLREADRKKTRQRVHVRRKLKP